jgi:hypothetical protein
LDGQVASVVELHTCTAVAIFEKWVQTFGMGMGFHNDCHCPTSFQVKIH